MFPITRKKISQWEGWDPESTPPAEFNKNLSFSVLSHIFRKHSVQVFSFVLPCVCVFAVCAPVGHLSTTTEAGIWRRRPTGSLMTMWPISRAQQQAAWDTTGIHGGCWLENRGMKLGWRDKKCVCVRLGCVCFSARLIVFLQLLYLLKTMTRVETPLLAIMSPRLLVSNRNNRTETGPLAESGLLTGGRTKRVCEKMSVLIFREQVNDGWYIIMTIFIITIIISSSSSSKITFPKRK